MSLYPDTTIAGSAPERYWRVPGRRDSPRTCRDGDAMASFRLPRRATAKPPADGLRRKRGLRFIYRTASIAPLPQTSRYVVNCWRERTEGPVKPACMRESSGSSPPRGVAGVPAGEVGFLGPRQTRLSPLGWARRSRCWIRREPASAGSRLSSLGVYLPTPSGRLLLGSAGIGESISPSSWEMTVGRALSRNPLPKRAPGYGLIGSLP